MQSLELLHHFTTMTYATFSLDDLYIDPIKSQNGFGWGGGWGGCC